MNRVFEMTPNMNDSTNYYYFEQGFSQEELDKIAKGIPPPGCTLPPQKKYKKSFLLRGECTSGRWNTPSNFIIKNSFRSN